MNSEQPMQPAMAVTIPGSDGVEYPPPQPWVMVVGGAGGVVKEDVEYYV